MQAYVSAVGTRNLKRTEYNNTFIYMLMKKKICLALVALLVSLTANAQFEKEKMYYEKI